MIGDNAFCLPAMKRAANSCLPAMKDASNSVWRIPSVLAFSLVRGFQMATTTKRRAPSGKRRAVYCFESIQTVRYTTLRQGGLAVCPAGRPTLEVGHTPMVRRQFRRAEAALKRAA